MIVRAFFAFVKKEFFHILRDRRTLFILFAMPVALIFIFGYTVTNEFKGASVAVIDRAEDDLSRELILHLSASGHFKIEKIQEAADQPERLFRAGKIKMCVVISPDFGPAFLRGEQPGIQLLTDASDPNYATTLRNYASQMIAAFQQQKSGIPPAGRLDIESRMLYNPKLIGAYNFIPGVAALILMLISAMMTSLTLSKEKETGTMDLLLISPLPPMLIIFGKVAPYILLAFTDALIVFGLGYYLFDVPILGSLPLLLLLSLLYLVVSLALGVLISAKAQTQQAAMIMSLFILLMPTMLLSDFMFSVDSMPLPLQLVSSLIPAKYFIKIQQAIMLKGAGREAVYFPAGVLLLMAGLLFTAAVRSFKVVSK